MFSTIDPSLIWLYLCRESTLCIAEVVPWLVVVTSPWSRTTSLPALVPFGSEALILKRNAVPCPTADSTTMSPPSPLQIYLQMYRPSPLPFGLHSLLIRLLEHQSRSNTFFLSSKDIPMPWSSTETLILTAFGSPSPLSGA